MASGQIPGPLRLSTAGLKAALRRALFCGSRGLSVAQSVSQEMKPNPRVKETSQRALLQRGVLCRRVLSALFLFLSAFLGFPGRRAEARLLLSGASPDRPPLRHFTKPAFLSPGEGAASHAPFPSARSSRCSTAACSLASFFRRRRGSKKTPQDEGSVPQEEPYPQTFDALRFLGLASEEGAPPLSSATLKARLSVLEAKRRALESLGGPPLLPLASELIQESVAAVSEALNRGQQQALDAVSSPALAALLPRLSELEAKPPNSLAAKRDGDDEASESGGCEDSSNGEFDEEADDDEEPPDLLSALLSGSPFHPSRARGRRGGFFGSGFFGRQGKAARGEHAEAEVEVGFREAALGGRPREVRFSRKDPCSACEGSGVKGGKGSAAASCESCKGKGVITKVGSLGCCDRACKRRLSTASAQREKRLVARPLVSDAENQVRNRFGLDDL